MHWQTGLLGVVFVVHLLLAVVFAFVVADVQTDPLLAYVVVVDAA